MPEWLMGADCKSAGYAYVGSNPTRPKSKFLFLLKKIWFSLFLGVISFIKIKNDRVFLAITLILSNSTASPLLSERRSRNRLKPDFVSINL